MFNLVVKYAGWVEGRDTIAAARTFEYTDPQLLEQFAPGGELDTAALSRLPTLFMQESFADGNQVARVRSFRTLSL